MKDEFFQKILNVIEHQPFITTVTRGEQASQTIAQIREGDHGELRATLQEELGSLFGTDDAATTITLPDALPGQPFGIPAFARSTPTAQSGRTVPLHPDQAHRFPDLDGETKRIINGESIGLAEPVTAKTFALWYENIWAEGWTTNVDREAVTISHGDYSATEIPPHGTTEFFITVEKPEAGRPAIEWDIGDTHQGVIIRTDHDNPFVKIAITPANDRDISWSEYVARIWVEHGAFKIKDVGIHVWRTDEAGMDLGEIKILEQALSHSLSFMNSTWCRPKVAIAWKETWSDNPWWGTWTPVWGAWNPTSPAKKNRTKNWMPIDMGLEKVLQEILSNIDEDHYPVIQRYVHNTMAMENGDWVSSITASVAILQRLAINSGIRIGRRELELSQGIAKYLNSKAIERPHYYVGWGEESEHLIECGESHDHLVKAITQLRNQVAAHWEPHAVPENAAWLAEQAIYYVEAAIRSELAPRVPMWDRVRGFHHPPSQDLSYRHGG